MIQNGGNVNHINKCGETALMCAAKSWENADTCLLLRENGAGVNEKSINGTTALMFAVIEGHNKQCRLIIQNGGNVN